MRWRSRAGESATVIAVLVASALALPGLVEAHAPEGTKPGASQHASEHAEVARAIAGFDRLTAVKQRQIRARLRQGTVDGRARRAAVDAPASVVGKWTSAPFQAPDYAIHALLLRGGRVLLFAMGSGHGASNGGQGLRNDGQATIWDPTVGEGPEAFTEVDPPPIALDDPQKRPDSALLRPAPIFCAGQVQLADGRVLIAGGNLDQDGYGLSILFLFDPVSETWIREPNMARYRWYPTVTRMADGRAAIVGGLDETHGDANSLELYPSPPSLVAGVDSGAPQQGLKTWEAPAKRWSGIYPTGFLLPSGRLASSYGGGGRIALFERPTGRWVERTPSNVVYGSYPTAFLKPGDQSGPREIAQVGGLLASGAQEVLTGAGFVVDPERERTWRSAPALNIARRNATAVLLPDGTAAVVNGGPAALRFSGTGGLPPSNVEQRKVELWDPTTGKWTVGPAGAVPRGYHSVALLLADGRVLAGGDDWVSSLLDTNRADRFDSTLEIYSPPYLFKGPRPTITGAPSAAGYGESIEITATGDRPVVRATLMAPGSVTHSTDMNQRLLKLPLKANGSGSYTVTGPTSSGAAPPGDYMLFVVDDAGVPSVAAWVRIRPSFPGQGAPVLTTLSGEEPAPTTPTPTTPVPTTPGSTTPAATSPAGPEPEPEPRVIPVPEPLPLIQAIARKLAPPTTATLRGRVLRLGLTLTPTGAGSCPKKVTVRVTVKGRVTERRLDARPFAADERAVCRSFGTVTLKVAPSRSAKVGVRVQGKGVATLRLQAKRA